ncbi:helix-turn-helix transcriptional regulator [Sciscionella marina]|uniref:helix-turn-helix transcriptional regulator n=1 Tax=Sciscionella marina TaxID=508770 RepID=UPI00038299B8|nr:YafY family protein [Sciscionella marina]
MGTYPSARLFRVLSLLQARRVWSGAELAERLGVTERTVRRDIDCLRELGYVIDSLTGTAGGYRLGAGNRLPPLQLEDTEAVAVAAALLTADRVGEPATRALAKLEQVLPKRLRPNVSGLAASTVILPGGQRESVDPVVLGALAAACRDHEILEFDYTRMDGTQRQRTVAPHHLIAGYGLWYLIGHDEDRADWRVFRVDRIREPLPNGRRFTPRALPVTPEEYLRTALRDTPYPYTAQAVVDADSARVAACLVAPQPWRVTALGEQCSRVRFGAVELDAILGEILSIARLAVPIQIQGPPELTERLQGAVAALTRSVHGR